MASSIMDCKTPRSLETSSACVPGAGPALPSGVCSVSGGLCASGSGIKAPLAADAWCGVRNSPPGQLRLGWGVWLLSLFGCCKLAGHGKELCNDGWENEISPFREGTASIEPCHASVCAQDATGAIKGFGICSCVSVREAEALRG